MIRVSVIYPNQDDSHFDMDYYMSSHLPLVAKLFGEYGLKTWRVDKGISLSSKGPSSFVAACYMDFDLLDSVKQAFKEKGGDVMGDVKNFTDIEPQVYFGELVGRG